jgi:hypothetical protein
MTITLPLQPQEEARLRAVAQAKGISTADLLREALDPNPLRPSPSAQRKKSLPST